MDESEIWELIRRAREEGIPLNEAQRKAAEELIRKRLGPDALRAWEEDLIEKGATSPGWWARFGRWIKTPGGFFRFGGYLALAYLFVAAVADSQVTQKPLSGGSGPCMMASGRKALSASDWATGPNGALKAALADLDLQCASSGLVCAPAATPACLPDVAVQNVDIKFRLIWYTVDATGICQCWLK